MSWFLKPIQGPIICQLCEHWQTVWGRSPLASHALSSSSTGGTCSSDLEGSDEAKPPEILSTSDYWGQAHKDRNAKLITWQRGARQISSTGLCWGQPPVCLEESTAWIIWVLYLPLCYKCEIHDTSGEKFSPLSYAGFNAVASDSLLPSSPPHRHSF